MKKYKNFNENEQKKFNRNDYIQKLSEEEGRNFIEIIDDINKGKIKIDCNGHNHSFGGTKNVNYFKKRLNDTLKHREDAAEKLTNNIITIDKLYKKLISGDVDLEINTHCHDCGKDMYGVLIDDIFSFIPKDKYWKITDTKPDKYDVKITMSELKNTKCPVYKLVDDKKIVTEIEVPSGQLVFANYFKNKETYDMEDSSLNDIQGRMKLMKHLAEKNIGYGQMGNMSVNIYSNRKEVIIGSEMDLYYDNKNYYDSNPEEIDDKWKKEVKDAEEYEKLLKDGDFKNFGEISLSVWRWQCGDKEILEKEFGEKFPGMKTGEKYTDDYEDFICIAVEPGTWVIEHYYDFPDNGDYLYSKLYKK